MKRSYIDLETLNRLARDIKLYGKPPANTRRVERTLKLIAFLNNKWRSHSECAEIMGLSERSIFRYLLLLSGFGFKVQKAGRFSVYRIVGAESYFTQPYEIKPAEAKG